MLQDYEFYGSGKKGSFRLDDLKALRSLKWAAKLERFFARTPYDFNIYAHNTFDGKCFGFDAMGGDHVHNWAGHCSFDTIYNVIGAYPPERNTSITVLLMENEGDERVPLSPWMLAHRISHSLFASAALENGPQAVIDAGRRYDEVFSIGFWDAYDRVQKQRSIFSMVDLAHEIGTNGAARNKKYNRIGEFPHDLMTQYMNIGEIRLNDAPEYQASLMEAARKMLDACVGHAFVL